MSLIDRFYEKNNIYFIVTISTPLQIATEQDGFTIKKTGIWEYTIEFEHNNYDLVMILEKIGCLKNEISVPQQNCYRPDFLWIRFFRHLHALYSPPFHRPSKPPEHEYFTGVLKKKNLLRVLDMHRDKTGRAIQFSSFLCALQIFFYHQITNCEYCKVQILCYLPWIVGKNRVFADVIHVPVMGKTFFEVVDILQTERHTSAELYSVYCTYDTLSTWANVEKVDIPHFDICFSNFPTPLLLYQMSIIKKTIQFENSYVQIISNQNDDVLFNFVNNRHICPMNRKFYDLWNNLSHTLQH